eukprot:RCo041283
MTSKAALDRPLQCGCCETAGWRPGVSALDAERVPVPRVSESSPESTRPDFLPTRRDDPRQPKWKDRHAGKEAMRQQVWSLLKSTAGAVEVDQPDPEGRIPCFSGSAQAANVLAGLQIWLSARVVKCNPDMAQCEVRCRALRDNKLLYMAVPRLSHPSGCCFIELDPTELSAKNISPSSVALWQDAFRHGRLVSFSEMRPIDLVVTGCVAVSRDGSRTGKGAGFADLELGILRGKKLVSSSTPVVTTVHPLQIVEDGQLPMEAHDTPLDWIITPFAGIRTTLAHPKPSGAVDWAAVREDQLLEIPALKHLREESSGL